MTHLLKQNSLYWFNPDPTKGSEIRKARPCIVVSPDEMNEAHNTVLVVPLTSTIIDWPFRVTINLLDQKSSAACDQLRAVDKSRLRNEIGSLGSKDQAKLYATLAVMFQQ